MSLEANKRAVRLLFDTWNAGAVPYDEVFAPHYWHRTASGHVQTLAEVQQIIERNRQQWVPITVEAMIAEADLVACWWTTAGGNRVPFLCRIEHEKIAETWHMADGRPERRRNLVQSLFDNVNEGSMEVAEACQELFTENVTHHGADGGLLHGVEAVIGGAVRNWAESRSWIVERIVADGQALAVQLTALGKTEEHPDRRSISVYVFDGGDKVVESWRFAVRDAI